MKIQMTISIKKRIYFSFLVLVCLFVVAGVVTNITLRDNKRMSEQLGNVINPSLDALEDFNVMLLESKMYTTNWVFLRSKQEDKKRLQSLHTVEYAALKDRIKFYTERWERNDLVDSIDNVLRGFEQLMEIEQEIMLSLNEFGDYDDPVLKLEAERKVEDEVLPRTAALTGSLRLIFGQQVAIRHAENIKLEKSASRLNAFMIFLAVAIVCTGFLLSLYLTKVIIDPVKKINSMIDDLGKGILRKIDYKGKNEISNMAVSVNNLSDNLHATANFAHEVGLRNFEISFQPLSDEDTLGKALITMRDNLKAGETNLARQNRELERKNRELEQFAYVASHDLQEPLQTTLSFVELLQQHYTTRIDEKGGRYLSYIVQASRRMKILISDLLEYSRIGAKRELEIIDCNVILDEVKRNLDNSIKATGARIDADILPVITGYQTEVVQLFNHLTNNAIKFRKKDTAPKLKIGARQRNDSWEFSFSDNGIGLAKENSERIFVIFQRLHTRNEYEGSGIGLSHCKKIVELHKGKIWLESEPGKGTIFYFTIPLNITN